MNIYIPLVCESQSYLAAFFNVALARDRIHAIELEKISPLTNIPSASPNTRESKRKPPLICQNVCEIVSSTKFCGRSISKTNKNIITKFHI